MKSNISKNLNEKGFADISDEMDKILGGQAPGNLGCKNDSCHKNKGCTGDGDYNPEVPGSEG